MTVPGGDEHTGGAAASPWVTHWAGEMPAGADVLDVACGGGRHARWLAARGHPVTGIDRDPAAAVALQGVARVTFLQADLEGAPWPFDHRQFGGVIVTNYLHRPILARIVAAVADGGILIYETFAIGNERFGRPSNPAFLLKPGELIDAVRGQLRVIAYEDVEVTTPRPARIQRICARRE
ncbi:MAG: class I SAM-dependent methyltransferase [Burkholderiales bacterium]